MSVGTNENDNEIKKFISIEYENMDEDQF